MTMNEGGQPSHGGVLLPLLATASAMCCFQVGAAAAKQLYPAVGPLGAASLRLLLGTAVLFALVRPWRHWPSEKPPLLALFCLGVSMAAAMLFYYLAIERLPLGIALSIQMTGPMALAACMSSRPRDFGWVVLAAGGVWCLIGTEPLEGPIDPWGVACALVAAAGWAGYIVSGRIAERAFGSGTAALGVGVAALLVLPVGIAKVGAPLFAPELLPLAFLVAILTAAVPFSLELYAIGRMPQRTFAVLTSLEPAFAVMSGFIFLGEHLSLVQITGVALVIGASAGTVFSAKVPPPN